MDKIVIRRMKPKDARVVYELGSKEKGFAVSSASGFWSRTELRRWAGSGADVNLVAEKAGKVVGFVLSQLHKSTGKATIENVYVIPTYRRQGVAKLLLKECLRRLKRKGASYVCGLVRKNNLPSKKMLSAFRRGYEFVWFEKLLS